MRSAHGLIQQEIDRYEGRQINELWNRTRINESERWKECVFHIERAHEYRVEGQGNPPMNLSMATARVSDPSTVLSAGRPAAHSLGEDSSTGSSTTAAEAAAAAAPSPMVKTMVAGVRFFRPTEHVIHMIRAARRLVRDESYLVSSCLRTHRSLLKVSKAREGREE